MASKETGTIKVEMEGIEKSLSLLFKLQESMAATAINAAQFVNSLNTVNNILTALAGASLKNVTAEIGLLGKAFNKFGQQFSTKGVKTLIETNSVQLLAKNLQSLAISVRGLPGSSAALTVIADGLKQLSSVINDKNFSVAGPSLRKVATALVFLAEKTKNIVVSEAAIKGLLALVGVFQAFKNIRGEASIGPALQSIAVGIGALNSSFSKASFILDPANAKSIESLGISLSHFGKAFTGFSKHFSADEIAVNMRLVITLLGELQAKLASFTNVAEFTTAIGAMGEGLGILSKSFRSLTVGKNLEKLQGNSEILIKFINDLATIDAAPIVAKLQPLSEVIKNLADAGRAIGALKGINTVKARITALGVEVERTTKKLTLWDKAVKFVVKSALSGIKSGIAAPFREASREITKYILSFVTSPITNFAKAIKALINLIASIPIKIATAAFNGMLTVLKTLLNVVVAILTPFINFYKTITKLFTKTKEIKKPVDDLSTSFDTLESNVQSATPKFDNFGNEIVKAAPSAKILGINLGAVGKAINSISSKTIDTLSGSLKKVTGNAGNFFIGFLGIDRILQIVSQSIRTVVRALGQLGKTIFDAYSETENLKASLTAFQAIELVDLGKFENIPSALEQANKQTEILYKKFQQIAKDSPFETSALVETFNTLQTFKFDSKAAETLTRILVDFGATVGVSNSELADFALIFGQIRASGKLLGQDMKQLQTRGLNVGEALSKAWKKWHNEVITNNEAIEKAQKGLISVDDVIVALAESMNTSFGGNAQRMNNTLTALASTLSDIKKTLLVDLFGPAIESAKPFLNILLEIIQSEKVAEIIKNLATVIEKNLVIALEGLGKAIKISILLWQAVPEPFKEMIKQALLFTAAIAGVTIAVGTLAAAASLVGFALSLVINPIGLVAGAIAGLTIIVKRNIGIISTAFTTLKENAITTFSTIYTSVATFVSKTVSKVAELTGKFATNFAATLNSMVKFGYNVIKQFANGILSALTLVVAAVKKLGSILTFWLSPGSPPRILPDIDKWGTSAAEEFLGGFGVADFSAINDFSGVLKNLLKSVKLEDVDTSGIVKSFSNSLSELNTTGSVDLSGAFAEIERTVPGASNEVQNLLQLYLKLSQQTNELNKSTTQYSDAINALEGDLANLEDSSLAQTEQKQIDRLESASQSQFLSEAQRQRALQEIQKIKTQQELRNLKKEEDGKQAAVEATKNEIDLLKERIDLANQFPVADVVIDPLDTSSGSDKLDKLKKDAEDAGDSIADSIGGGIEDIELALSNMSLDLPELNVDGIMSKFDELSKGVNDTFAKIQIRIRVFIEKVKGTYATLVAWKDEVIRVFNLVVAAAKNTNNVDVKKAFLGIDLTSLDTFATSLGTIAGTIGNNLNRIYENLKKEFTKIGNIISEVESGGGTGDVLGALLGFDTNDVDGSIGRILGNISLAIDGIYAGIKTKVGEFVTLLQEDPTLTLQDALSQTLFEVDFETAVALAKIKLATAIDEIVNYIPTRIALIQTLLETGATPAEAIMFAFFRISPATTDEIIAKIKDEVDKIKTSFDDILTSTFREKNETLSEYVKQSIGIDFTKLAGIVATIGTILKPLTNIFTEGEWGMLFASIGNFIRALSEFLPVVLGFASAIAAPFILVIASVLQEIPLFLSGVLDTFSAALDFVSDTVDSIILLLTGRLSFKEFVQKLGDDARKNFSNLEEGLTKVVWAFINVVYNLIDNIFAVFGKDVDSKQQLTDFVEGITKFFSELPGKIEDAVRKLPDNLKALAEKFIGIGASWRETIISTIDKFLLDVGATIVGYFEDFIKNIKTVISDFYYIFTHMFDDNPTPGDNSAKPWYKRLFPTPELLAEVTDPIKEKIEGFFTGISSFVSGIEIVDIFAGVKTFTDGIGERLETIKTAFTDIQTFFTSFKLPNIFEAFEIPESVKAILRLAGIDVGGEIASAASSELQNINIDAPEINTLEWSAAGTTGGQNIATGVEDGFDTEANKAGFFQNAKDSVLSTWAKLFDSHSPSVVAANEMGLPIAQGVAKGILDGLIEADFPLIFDTMYLAITTSTTTFTDLYKVNFANFALAHKMALAIFVTDVETKYQNMSDRVMVIVDAMFALILAATEVFKLAFIEIARLAIVGFLKEFEGLGEKTVVLIEAALTVVREAFDENTEPAYVAGLTIGEAIGGGIIGGIENKFSGVINTIKRLIAEAIAAAKKALDSNSPSKVTAKEIGEPFGEGVGVGVEKSFEEVDKMITKKLQNLGAKSIAAPKINQLGRNAFDTNSPYVSSKSGGLQNTNMQRALQTANNTTIVNNFSKEYHMHMTVTPERATQVTRNFNVAEFIGI